MGSIKKAVSALVLGATLAGATATAADAQRYRGGRGYYGHRGGVSSGAAVGIGILGLGLGAALASRPRYYDGGGYYGGGRGYYGGGGYGNYGAYGGDYAYGPECYTRRVYDPYLGRRVRIRECY